MTVSMHITMGDMEPLVSKQMPQTIVLGTTGEVREYHEYPGVDHYILNDGIHMEEMIYQQIDFLERIMK